GVRGGAAARRGEPLLRFGHRYPKRQAPGRAPHRRLARVGAERIRSEPQSAYSVSRRGRPARRQGNPFRPAQPPRGLRAAARLARHLAAAGRRRARLECPEAVARAHRGRRVCVVKGEGNRTAQPVGSGLGEGQVFLGTGSVAPDTTRPEQVSRIYRLNDPALSEMELEPLLNELLGRIKEILSVDTVAILLLDDKGEELVARAARGLEEEVERGFHIPIGSGYAGRIAAERAPIFIADVDHADVVNPILRQKGIRSLLGVPLIVEADLLGVLHVGTLKPRTFTNEDAAVLQLAANRVAPAIERSRLFQALAREHRAGVMLQRSLLPDRLPELVGLPVAARYFPARDEVGGDWYDVMELPRGKIGVAIGDVVGHGIGAAALMGQLRTALRAYAIDGYEPAGVLERLNRLVESIRGRGMATAGYATFDKEQGTLRFALAGHPPPAIAAPGGEARLLETSPGAPLGALSYSRYVERETTLADGEILILYTDGLVELREQ